MAGWRSLPYAIRGNIVSRARKLKGGRFTNRSSFYKFKKQFRSGYRRKLGRIAGARASAPRYAPRPRNIKRKYWR